ncbi:MAG: BACON domain-containing protein [Planctomycetota bacterium]|jgi:hypothetical protein
MQSATRLRLKIPQEGSDAVSDAFTVKNSGGDILQYTISANASWLSVSPASGTSTGEANSITVDYHTSSLEAGVYNAMITVEAIEASNSPQTIDVNLTVNAVGSKTVDEDFESMPDWSSSYDAAWGNAASWTITGGLSGNALQASRANSGSSGNVAVYAIEANTNYTISAYMRCSSWSSTYWAEFAFRLGHFTAQDFDSNPSAWSMIQKFSKSGTNGNGNIWQQYTTTFNSGSYTQVSVGFKLGSTGSAPPVQWDTLQITAEGAPPVAEDFAAMPGWTYSYDAGWGSAAAWTVVGGGQSGNALQAARSAAGSSSKVIVYDVKPNMDYTISVYVRCPGGSSGYWAEAAFRLGNHSAQNFDASADAWTMLKKFSNSGTNGNGDRWTRYALNFHSSSHTQISVGFKLGSTGSGLGYPAN